MGYDGVLFCGGVELMQMASSKLRISSVRTPSLVGSLPEAPMWVFCIIPMHRRTSAIALICPHNPYSTALAAISGSRKRFCTIRTGTSKRLWMTEPFQPRVEPLCERKDMGVRAFRYGSARREELGFESTSQQPLHT